MMEFDELFSRARGLPVDGGRTAEAKLAGLDEALRRLHNEAAERERIDLIVAEVDLDRDADALARSAIDHGDLDTAERWMRRSAEHGHGDAAFLLSLILARRSDERRERGDESVADALADEAAGWRERAEAEGAAEAMEDDPLVSRLRDVPASAGRRRITAMPAISDDDELAPPVPGAVGVDIRPYHCEVVFIDERGDIQASRSAVLADMDAPRFVVRDLAPLVAAVVSEGLDDRFPRDRVPLGVGLGCHVNTVQGLVPLYTKAVPGRSGVAPAFRWTRVNLARLLTSETGLQAAVINDAAALAVKERWHGVGLTSDDFAVLVVREGIGAKVVKDGKVYGPGEVGLIINNWPAQDFANSLGQIPNADGRFGALEAVGGTSAILNTISLKAQRRIDTIEAAAQLAEQRASNDRAVEIALDTFRASGKAVAIGIHILLAMAEPEHVVLHAPGPMLNGGRAAREFLEAANSYRELVDLGQFRDCKLELRSEQPYDGAHGAALAVIERQLHLPGPKPARAAVKKARA